MCLGEERLKELKISQLEDVFSLKKFMRLGENKSK